MSEGQDQTRQDQISQDRARGSAAPDRNTGRVPAQNPDEPPRPPRIDGGRTDDPRKDAAATARPTEAPRTTDSARTNEPTRTRTNESTRTTDATRASEAKHVADPTRSGTGDAPRTGDATRATDPARTTEAARTGEGSVPRAAEHTAETHTARHGGAAGSGDGLEERLQHAMGTFVDEPRKSVEEADAVLEQVARQLTEKLAERRRTLRSTWQNDDAKADTEDLRVALTHYRDLTQQLLGI